MKADSYKVLIGTLIVAFLLQAGMVPAYWRYQLKKNQLTALKEDLADAPLTDQTHRSRLSVESENNWTHYQSQIPTWESFDDFVDHTLQNCIKKWGLKLKKMTLEPAKPYKNGFYSVDLTIEAEGPTDQLLSFWRTWESFYFLSYPKLVQWRATSSGQFQVKWVFNILLV